MKKTKVEARSTTTAEASRRTRKVSIESSNLTEGMGCAVPAGRIGGHGTPHPFSEVRRLDAHLPRAATRLRSGRAPRLDLRLLHPGLLRGGPSRGPAHQHPDQQGTADGAADPSARPGHPAGAALLPLAQR